MQNILYRGKARWGDNPVGNLKLPYVSKIVNSFGEVEKFRFMPSDIWDCSVLVHDDWVDGEFPIGVATKVLGYAEACRLGIKYRAAVTYTKQALELYKNVDSIITGRFLFEDWQFGVDMAYESRPQDVIVKKHDYFMSLLLNNIEFAGECGSVVLMDNIGSGGSVVRAFTVADFLVYLCRLHKCNVFAYDTVNIASTEGAMYTIKLVHNSVADLYFTKLAVLGGVI